jgi:hypothetical protein
MPSFESLPNVKMLLILFLQKMFKKECRFNDATMILHMNLNIIENGEHTNKIDLQHFNLDIKKPLWLKDDCHKHKTLQKQKTKTQQGKKITKNANLNIIQD